VDVRVGFAGRGALKYTEAAELTEALDATRGCMGAVIGAGGAGAGRAFRMSSCCDCFFIDTLDDIELA
jgi:hypothetical protein